MEELSDLFRSILLSHRNSVQEFLTDYDLYLGQPRLLFYLKDNPGSTQNDLADFLEITKEATSVSVRRLEKSGFIIRKTCDSDRRRNRLYVSKHGEEVLTKISGEFDKINYKMYASLNDNEIDQLKILFRKIKGNLEGSGDDI